jgi:molecular chaperone DnaK
MISDILEKLKVPTLKALKDAQLEPDQINKVIFVGGSTRIPSVARLVKEIMGKDGDKSVNPDEAVALGAAIQGAILGGEVKDVLLLDVTPLSLGIETLGGVFTQIIDRNTTIPVSRSQVFSTASDNQPAVTIRVAQGERPMFLDNKLLGQFDLVGIPPAPRGIPKIEVAFDIDANGIINVKAKDLGTNKEQKITITSSTNLTKTEIERMRKEAEAHSEEDKKRKEEIEIVNNADTLVYSAEKLFADFEGKADAKELEGVKKEVGELQSLLAAPSKDVHAIKKKMDSINKVIQGMSTKMYEKASEQYKGSHQDAHQENAGKKKKDEKVVDADYKVEDEK